MSNLKTYTVKASWFNDAEVTLQVDHDLLTPELAKEINDFWSDASYRLRKEDEDVVRVVIRMFGARTISLAMEQGGWDFSKQSVVAGLRTAQEVIDSYGEGWPKAEELGIYVIQVAADSVGFDDVELEAVE
ncbi:DUF2528 family protein [Comamonas thiooxydans]|uniref:DUF2528 family protein n=1 Tax=Comamonas thiooxydans TaxID=363952 RepID=UPI000B3648DF|nr:DUF2528 family protein [Comamonas thiooxydans]BDR08588.1 DUF2528 family protein [Comamonas thiooxydans]